MADRLFSDADRSALAKLFRCAATADRFCRFIEHTINGLSPSGEALDVTRLSAKGHRDFCKAFEKQGSALLAQIDTMGDKLGLMGFYQFHETRDQMSVSGVHGVDRQLVEWARFKSELTALTQHAAREVERIKVRTKATPENLLSLGFYMMLYAEREGITRSSTSRARLVQVARIVLERVSPQRDAQSFVRTVLERFGKVPRLGGAFRMNYDSIESSPNHPMGGQFGPDVEEIGPPF